MWIRALEEMLFQGGQLNAKLLPWVGSYLAKRQKGLDAEIIEIAWKAQHRLHSRYKKLLAAGKNKPQIVTAVGREMLGFIWAIAVKTEAKYPAQQKAAA
jgi:transposase